MEHALISVKMVVVGYFTPSSLRKQALAFPVWGSNVQMGCGVPSGMHQLWNMGLSEGFVSLSRRGGEERNLYSHEEVRIISASLF